MIDSKQMITVAVGVIKNNDQILLAKRPDNVHQGGKWEFPGGKVEPNESVSQALVRELKEELSIEIAHPTHFMNIEHDYPEVKVHLSIYLIEQYKGVVTGNEGQAVEWVAIEDLHHWALPEANKPIVDRLQQVF